MPPSLLPSRESFFYDCVHLFSVQRQKLTKWSAHSSGDETDVAVIIGIDPTRKEIVVSYRGTIDIRNWIVNLSFAQSSCSDLTSGCKVHHGFQWAWSETGSVVMAAVAEAKQKYPTYNVIATGHSLGAAMATIATAYLRQAGHATDLYTYGSPRVGNLAFVEFVTNQGGSENRVTKLDDPVPRLPPIFTGYRHTSPEYWIDEVTDASDNITASEITTCLGYANTDCNAGQLGFSITAHLNYFQHTGSCDTGESSKRGLEGSSVAASFVSDEDLEEQLKIYFQQDIDYAKSKRL